MNRWELMAAQARARVGARRAGLAGQYIDDFYTPSRAAAAAADAGRAPFVLPPAAPIPDLGRLMSAEEAQALADRLRLLPPALLIPRGDGGGGGLSAAVNPAGQVETVRPPWTETPPGGQAFTYSNAAALTLPLMGTQATVVQFQVPKRKNGVIEFIANIFVGGGWTEGTGDLIWRITADGVPVQGYDFLIASLGTMSNPGWLGSRPIRISENQIIALVVQNVGIVPAGQPLLGLFRGGFYPIEQEGQNTWL